ncbi:MAG: hypothetical protein J0H00_02985 [Burkholderiales bacterium]|nr:hypothetical protein [Burkholderiales bacterium]OJX05531.1 MAG: hypothetical protein BGO72_09580 [Burkholderiales bacterium 70-64]
MMIRSGVSRWTMVHFGLAIVALLAAEVLFVLGYSDPLSGLRAPATLVAVHLLTIGWLSLLMLGALYQFVPVITNTRLYSQRLPLYSLIAIITGLAAMLAGFLALGGLSVLTIAWLPIGGSLVIAGFALGAIDLWVTLWRVRPLPLPAGFVAVGLGFLLLTGLIGLGFALTFTLPQPPGFLLALTAEGLSLHLAAGLGGWFTLTVMGVSYRLLSMFMLSPDEPHRTTYAALILTVTGLLLLIAAGLGGAWAGLASGWGKSIGAALAGLGVAFYLVDIARFYRTRSRRHLELNSTTAAAALGLVTLALAAGALAAAWGVLDRFAGAIGYLFVLGGLTGLGLSQLYKVVPFLTWLELFGPKLGKGPVPRVQDLVDERRAMPWFVLYFATALAAAGSIALDQAPAWRLAAGLQLAATVLIVIELWRSRHPDPNLKPAPMKLPVVPAPGAKSAAFASPSSRQRSTT